MSSSTMLRQSFLTILAIGFLASPAFAAETEKKPAAAAVAPAPAGPAIADIIPLKEYQDRTKARIEHMGHKFGLDIWMAVTGPSLQMIYTTPDKKAMLMNGMLYTAGPTDETSSIQRDFILKNPQIAEDILTSVGNSRVAISKGTEAAPAVSLAGDEAAPTAKSSGRSEAFWSDLSVARFIPFGPQDSKKIVYVFSDPTCDHCHALWQKLQPAFEKRHLQARLVPIAIQGKTSEEKVAQLMSQPDLAAAWTDIVAGKTLGAPANVTGHAALATNQKLMTNYKIGSTPVMVYRDAKNDKVRLLLGNPDDINVFFADIGLDEAPASTPAAPAKETPAPSSDNKNE
ncbi:MAG TPA: thioredoxin fold domain-containing protein [Alphaproteobacteria bacterium]